MNRIRRIFQVHCPSCLTEFPIDSAKVPEKGVAAICSVCLRVFPVHHPEDVDLGAGVAALGYEGATEALVEEEEGGIALDIELPDEIDLEVDLPRTPSEIEVLSTFGFEEEVEWAGAGIEEIEENDIEVEPPLEEDAETLPDLEWDVGEVEVVEEISPGVEPSVDEAPGPSAGIEWVVPEFDAVEEIETVEEIEVAEVELEPLVEGAAESPSEVEGPVDEAEVVEEISLEVEFPTGELPSTLEEEEPAEPADESAVSPEPAAAPPPPEVSSVYEAPVEVTPPPPPKPEFEDLSSFTEEVLAEAESSSTPAPERVRPSPEKMERFGRRDPHERARHLARVLVSDIIAYYPVRYQESLARRTLPEDFADEVQKSYREYVDQVGAEMAESTPYFVDALNHVLGRGEKFF